MTTRRFYLSCLEYVLWRTLLLWCAICSGVLLCRVLFD